MNILDLFFPRRCIGCGKWGRYFCKECVIHLPFLKHQMCPECMRPAIDGATHPRCRKKYSLDGMTSFFRYRGVIRSAVKSIKYRFVSDVAEEFIGLLPSHQMERLQRCMHPHALVPVPLHPSRLSFRGFNQSEVLGKFIAERMHIPIRNDLVVRVKKTIPQVEMKDRKKRLENMKGVFSIHKSLFINQKSTVIIFDDVCTTGATMRSVAKMLKQSGIQKVWGMVIAHG